MPKERFHILLAEEVLATGRVALPDERARFSFRLGAISPDLFFYDFPLFALSGFGNRLHDLLHESGMETAQRAFAMLGPLPPASAAWLLGFSCHFLADSIWHPVIDDMTESRYAPCARRGLEDLDCHRWIESELEACWIPLLGPRDGYRGVLREFLAKREWTRDCMEFYGRMLIGAGLAGVPQTRRIERCLRAQVKSLLFFSSRWPGAAQDRLLKNPSGARSGTVFGRRLAQRKIHGAKRHLPCGPPLRASSTLLTIPSESIPAIR